MWQEKPFFFFYPTMIQEQCRVIRLERLSADTWRLFLAAPGVAARVHAGQFVMLGVSAGYDPLLRRPFSIHDADKDKGEITLFFRVVGKGTEMLAAVRSGDELSLLGPLGNGFKLAPAPALLVGGGIGIAPLLLLAKELKDKGNQAAAIILAGRTKAEVAPLETSFTEWVQDPKSLIFYTDDGSFGKRGRANEALAQELDSIFSWYLGNDDDPSLLPQNLLNRLPLPSAPVVYTCGPQPMLRAIALFCRDHQIKCQVSVESAMACGMGACLGCALPDKIGGHVHVCLDGPVFDAEALPWD